MSTSKKKDKKHQGRGKINEEGNKLIIAENSEVPRSHFERVEPCNDAKQAGRAALLRLFNSDQSSSKGRRNTDKVGNGLNKKPKRVNRAPNINNKEFFAVQGVFFKCPQLGSEILSEKDWKDKIFNHLKRELEIDKHTASCLMIHSLNRAFETRNCIQILETIIDNIILHPKDDKYKKIRFMNKVFQEKISKSVGAVEFLESLGFIKKKDDSEDCYVYPHDKPDVPHLKGMLQLLKTTKPIKLELHRNASVLKPSQVNNKVDLPDEFFVRTIEEVKREQELRTINLEKAMTLRTKDMRETKPKATNNYLYSLIRIRFPDGSILQATFGTFETLKVLKKFVRECVVDNVRSFNLITALGAQLDESDDNKSLNELNLMPAVLLTFVPTRKLPAGLSYFVSPLPQKKT